MRRAARFIHTYWYIPDPGWQKRFGGEVVLGEKIIQHKMNLEKLVRQRDIIPATDEQIAAVTAKQPKPEPVPEPVVVPEPEPVVAEPVEDVSDLPDAPEDEEVLSEEDPEAPAFESSRDMGSIEARQALSKMVTKVNDGTLDKDEMLLFIDGEDRKSVLSALDRLHS